VLVRQGGRLARYGTSDRDEATGDADGEDAAIDSRDSRALAAIAAIGGLG